MSEIKTGAVVRLVGRTFVVVGSEGCNTTMIEVDVPEVDVPEDERLRVTIPTSTLRMVLNERHREVCEEHGLVHEGGEILGRTGVKSNGI